jgi:hypothetical protein
VREDYQEWSGTRVRLKAKSFNDAMRRHGFQQDKVGRNGVRAWRGLRLQDHAEEMDECRSAAAAL